MQLEFNDEVSVSTGDLRASPTSWHSYAGENMETI